MNHLTAPTRCARAIPWLLLGLAGPASATVWFGGSGSWLDAANWSAGVPGAGDTAEINAGTATLSAAATINALRLTGGVLAGTGTLTSTGASLWSGGTMTSAGISRFEGALAISGNTGKGLTGNRVLQFAGTTTWGGNTVNGGNTLTFNGGTIDNSAAFNDTNAFNALMDTQGITAFNNSGSYTKTGGAVTSIEVGFNNTGTVTLNAGRLTLWNGISSGSFTIGAGSTLAFVFGSHTLNAATTSGAGTLEVAGGNLAINGGSHGSAVLISSGNLGGSGNTFGGAVTWTGGTLTGAGTTRFENTLAISGNTGKGLTGNRVLQLAGTTTWGGNTANGGNTLTFNGGTIDNSAVFNDTNAFNALMDTQGITAFNNSGSYTKTGSAITAIEVGFNNTGTVTLNAGRLTLWNGISSGSFTIGAGSTLAFVFGSHTLNAATTSGGGTLEVAGGNLAINGGSHGSAVLISSGNLGGSGNTFGGAVTWTGGTLTGAGTTRFENTLAISGNTGKGLTGNRVLQLAGTTTWGSNTVNGGNTLTFNGGTIDNSGGFNDTNAFNALMDTQGITAFNNSGSYTKTGGAITTIEVVLNNSGSVNVAAGLLSVSSDFDNVGTITTASGATFGASNAFRDLKNHGLLQGTGSYQPAVGRTLLNSARIAPGSVGGVGLLHVAGNLTEAASGALEIDLASLASFDVLAVSGNTTLGGSLKVFNAGYVPVVGDSFVVLTYGQRLAGSTFDSIVAQGFGAGVLFDAQYNVGDVTLRVVAVPEPASALLWLAGLALMGAGLRRRRS